MIHKHNPPSLSLSLSLSLCMKEMASSNLVVFLAMLLVLLPMTALGTNYTWPLDPFFGTTSSILFFVFLLSLWETLTRTLLSNTHI